MSYFHQVRVVVRPLLFGGWSVNAKYTQVSEQIQPTLDQFGNVIVLHGVFSSRNACRKWAKKIRRIVSIFPHNHFRKNARSVLIQPTLF